MAFTVTFNGRVLTDLVRFITIDRGGLELDAHTQDIGGDGIEYLFTRRKSKTIECTFKVKNTDVAEARHELAEIADSSGLFKLEFSDEPNFYYMATVTGSAAFSEKKGRLTTGTLSFLVPDGTAHEQTRAVLDASSSGGVNGTLEEKDGYILATVNNNGTAAAFPRFEITNTAENGYIGIASANGDVFEVGNPEENDGNTYKQSEALATVKTAANFTAAMKAGTITKSPVSDAIAITGTLGWNIDGIRNTALGAASSKAWRVGVSTLEIPADSEGNAGAQDWRLDFNLRINAGTYGQLGILQLLVVDASDNIIAGYQTHKASNKNNTVEVKRWSALGGVVIGSFEANNGESNQKKPNKAFSSSTGGAYMRKIGAKIEFYFNGSVYSVNVDSTASTKAARVHVLIGTAGSASASLVTHLSVRSLIFTKVNVEKWDDVPNRYPAGSVLAIDSESDTIELDGVRAGSERVVGPDFVKLSKGVNTLEIYPSTWAKELPKISISWRNRKL